tara:strand:- start:79 stop:264 length:186 start_codon:yes stop_codon:yes gene_type:complete
VIQQLVTPELIERLDEVFPAVPDASMSHREIDQQIGTRQVVTYIKMLLKDQNSEPINLEAV